jgi:hypothetical protein
VKLEYKTVLAEEILNASKTLKPLSVLMSDGNNQSAVACWPSVRTQANRATQATLPVTLTAF